MGGGLAGLFLVVSCLLKWLKTWRVSVVFHAWAPHSSKATEVRHTQCVSAFTVQPSLRTHIWLVCV